jgi:hypothetical protein
MPFSWPCPSPGSARPRPLPGSTQRHVEAAHGGGTWKRRRRRIAEAHGSGGQRRVEAGLLAGAGVWPAGSAAGT